MKLEDTIGLMCSDDYKDRMKAEYLQLAIRLRKIRRYYDGRESNADAQGQNLLSQIVAMSSYKSALRRRLDEVGIFADTLDAISGEE